MWFSFDTFPYVQTRSTILKVKKTKKKQPTLLVIFAHVPSLVYSMIRVYTGTM